MKAVTIPSIGISLLAIGTIGCASMEVKEASIEGGCKTDLHGNDECNGKGTIK